MPIFTDQIGRTIDLPNKPRKIVSLVPSQTELLAFLGLEEEVVGITKFCVHPTTWYRSKMRIGGTKNIALDRVKALQPDLIIANKEENLQAQVEALAERFPVWVSDVHNLETALDMIEQVGLLTGREVKAGALVRDIQKAFADIIIPAEAPRPQAGYLIWKKPYMTVGGDTFISYMLECCGFQNYFNGSTRYPEVTVQELQHCNLVLLSSEPYPFREKDINELQEQLPGAAIELVDGEMFSWYGSRLLGAPLYFKQLRERLDLKL